MRAYSPTEIENLQIPELPLDGEWERAFGRPSRFERWFIDGASASGKSTFVMMLAKKLCDYGKVEYVSLEEGANLSFKTRSIRLRMKDVAGSFKVVTRVTVAEIAERLAKPKSANYRFGAVPRRAELRPSQTPAARPLPAQVVHHGLASV